jgi:hypothetical protein
MKKAVPHSDLYEPAKVLLFKLPKNERLELTKEVIRKEWGYGFKRAHEGVANALKAKGLGSKDVDRLLEDIRKG